MEKEIYLYKSPNYAANLNNMRLSDKLCDVTIKVGNRKLRAHKVVLAANLKYFESMFLNSFQESKQDVIQMKGIEGTNFEAFIAFAYTGEILLTDSNALNVLEVANYLSEEGIKNACIEFLKKCLKVEAACDAYRFASTIDCLVLKNLTRQTILSNFQDCSQTTKFLDFDFESLKDIISNVSSEFADKQSMCFEGIMRWIVHDVKNRKFFIEDLLSFIDMTKLAADYLLEYFCKSIENQDYDNITKDVMSFYRKNCKPAEILATPIAESRNRKQNLLIVGGINKKLCFQIYDFTKKKWSEPEEITRSYTFSSGYVWNCGAILNDKFYYIINHKNSKGNFQTDLLAFDPVTKHSTILTSDNRLLSYTAICACTKYLYFCGGEKFKKESDQILRYDLQTNSFETLPTMKNKISNATALFYQNCLYVIGGFYDTFSQDTVEKYDPSRNEWTTILAMRKAYGKCSAAVLNEKLYVCGGGWGKSSVEAYDPSKNRWQLVANMNEKRRYFVLIAHEGKLLAIGGDDRMTAEVYDSHKDQWQKNTDLALALQISNGTGGLIQSF